MSSEVRATTLSFTVHDPTGQSFAYGTYSFSFSPNYRSNGNAAAYRIGNATFTQYFTGNLDVNGAASLTIPDNTTITPSGSQWTGTFCPNADFPCTSVIFTVSGSTQDASAIVNGQIPTIQISSTPNLVIAYSQYEITGRLGSAFWNQAANALYVCSQGTATSCTLWSAVPVTDSNGNLNLSINGTAAGLNSQIPTSTVIGLPAILVSLQNQINALSSTTTTVGTPVFTPAAPNSSNGTVTVTITVSPSTAAICWSTTGTPAASTPGVCSAGTQMANGGSITFTSTSTLKAIGTLAGATNSAVATGVYTITTPQYWNYTPTLYVSATGSGTTCTQASPCSWSYGMNTAAVAGSVVQFAAGNYPQGNGCMKFNTSGTSGSPIVATCSTLFGCHVTNTQTAVGCIVGLYGNYQVLDGFDISSNNIANAVPQAVFITGNHNTVSRNYIHDHQPTCSSNGGGGVQVASSTSTAGFETFDANFIIHIGNLDSQCITGNYSQYDGILCEQDAGLGGCTITNNIISDVHGGYGINIGGAGGTASNNLIFNNGDGGIVLVSGTASVTLANNNIVNNGTDTGNRSPTNGVYGLGVTCADDTLLNNNIFGNKPGPAPFSYYSQVGTFSPSGDVSVDPSSGMFINWKLDGTGDYHSATGSSMINGGVSTTAPNHDYAGNPRPVNAYDIGPYEQ
jgi:hypothetical protein